MTDPKLFYTNRTSIFQHIGEDYVLEYRPYEPLDKKGQIHFELIIWNTHKNSILPVSECVKTVYLK